MFTIQMNCIWIQSKFVRFTLLSNLCKGRENVCLPNPEYIEIYISVERIVTSFPLLSLKSSAKKMGSLNKRSYEHNSQDSSNFLTFIILL